MVSSNYVFNKNDQNFTRVQEEVGSYFSIARMKINVYSNLQVFTIPCIECLLRSSVPRQNLSYFVFY